MLRRVLLVLAGVLVVGGLGAGVASAALVYPFVGQLAPSGGEFDSPGGVAVDAANGDTYVVDEWARVVDVFETASGTQLASLEGSSTPAGSFGASRQIAVAANDASGDVYVLDAEHGVVDVFNSLGAYTSQITGSETPAHGFSRPGGIAVDEATGEVYVVDARDGVVDVFDAAGVYAGRQISLESVEGGQGGYTPSQTAGIAVDDQNGDVYVADSGRAVVYVFNASTGGWVTTWTGANTPAGSFATEGIGIVDVAADNTTGAVYVTTRLPGTYEWVADVFESSGGYVAQFNHSFYSPEGIAVDQASGRIYVANDNRLRVVDVFDPGVFVPYVATGSASGVLATGATLNGVVNPEGVLVTDCHFDYGTSTAYGQEAACEETVGAGTGEVQVQAVLSGLAPASAYHFRLQASNANPNATNPGRDETFTTGGPPSVEGQSASNVTNRAATLGAQINPDGLETTYRFEYGTTTGYGASIPVPDGVVGSGRGGEPVSAEITGLQAATTYHYRVVAVNSQGTVPGPDETLTTLPAAVIEGVSSSDLTAEGATLHAQIDPLALYTTYHFEYGTSTSYGHSLPLPDAVVGASSSAVAVSQHLTGLSTSTTYHYRVAATNSQGTAFSADHTFIYDTTGEGLPDGRAYEMVTPPGKNGALLLGFNTGEVAVAKNGSRVLALSLQCFGGGGVACTAGRNGLFGTPYAFTRTAGGWAATSLAPPAQFGASAQFGAALLSFSADAGAGLFSMSTAPAGEDDLYARRPDGSVGDIGPLYPPASGALGPVVDLIAMSTADFSHVVYSVSTNADGEYLWPFDATQHSQFHLLYEYVGAGNAQPVLVGVSGGAGSTDLIGTCATTLGSREYSERNRGALSADGRTVYFTSAPCGSGSGANAGIPVPAYALYARVDESRTVAISQRSPLDCTGVCQTSSPGAAEFQGASEDGSKAFFTDPQQLTDGASEGSENLYLYDFANPAGHNLVDVSAGDSSSGGPRVRGVVAISPDGSHVYFVAQGVLSAGANGAGQSAQDGADNLYVYERDARFPDGHVAFVTALPASEAQSRWEEGVGHSDVTPDGRFLVFTSGGQVFRYDALTDGLVRVSIGERGFNDNGAGGTGIASIVIPAKTLTSYGANVIGWPRPDPTMSDDGAYVFFQSPVALTPRALNDAPTAAGALAQNVYEWHEGHVYLISDGKDTAQTLGVSAVTLLGSDASGANVFFSTADRLVFQDTDTGIDF